VRAQGGGKGGGEGDGEGGGRARRTGSTSAGSAIAAAAAAASLLRAGELSPAPAALVPPSPARRFGTSKPLDLG
jgi:hypothetical protein